MHIIQFDSIELNYCMRMEEKNLTSFTEYTAYSLFFPHKFRFQYKTPPNSNNNNTNNNGREPHSSIHPFTHCPTHVTFSKSEMNLNDARSAAATTDAMALSHFDDVALHPHLIHKNARNSTRVPIIVGIQLIEFLFFRAFAIFFQLNTEKPRMENGCTATNGLEYDLFWYFFPPIHYLKAYKLQSIHRHEEERRRIKVNEMAFDRFLIRFWVFTGIKCGFWATTKKS